MRPPLAPIARAASTYSCSLMRSTSPRTIRAIVPQYMSANTMSMEKNAGPSSLMPEKNGLFSNIRSKGSLSVAESRITTSRSGRE